MEFCRFFRSVKFVVRSLGQFLGRDVCLWLQRSQVSRVFSVFSFCEVCSAVSISQTVTPLQ